MRSFLLYCIRWQLSTPVLAICWKFEDIFGIIGATILANLIGASIFFFVDKQIFKNN